MTDGLFDLQGTEPPQASSRAVPVTERQVDQIRELFKTLGIEDQAERQAFVESVVGTQIDGLRALSRFQALRVIEALSRRDQPRGQGPQRSAWDDRDEDTWIDKL